MSSLGDVLHEIPTVRTGRTRGIEHVTGLDKLGWLAKKSRHLCRIEAREGAGIIDSAASCFRETRLCLWLRDTLEREVRVEEAGLAMRAYMCFLQQWVASLIPLGGHRAIGRQTLRIASYQST